MLDVNWGHCTNDSWCSFLDLNLANSYFDCLEGVYIIWHGGNNAKTVRVGQGIIRDRIAVHRDEDEILEYKNLDLFVTWAQVSKKDRGGVEKFLAEELNPLVGKMYPDVELIEINLPW